MVEELPDRIDELVKDWRRFAVGLESMARSLLEHVSESAPFFVDEGEKSHEGSRVFIEDQLDEGCNLRSSVPAVTAVCDD